MSLYTTPAEAGHPARKMSKVEPPTCNPDQKYCSYFVKRKQRFCRTECRRGSLYCCTHDVGDTGGASVVAAQRGQEDMTSSPSNPPSSATLRVPCPVNPNHTVYASRLKRHLTVCPDLRHDTRQLSYFSKDKNANRGAIFLESGRSASPEETTQRPTHRDLSAEDLTALISKIHECYDTCIAPDIVVLKGRFGDGDTVSGEADATSLPRAAASPCSSAPVLHGEARSLKHGPQHMALLRCLSDVVRQVYDTDSILVGRGSGRCAPVHVDGFLELGAGKGGLSLALQQLIVQRLEHLSSHVVSGGEGAKAASMPAPAPEATVGSTPPIVTEPPSSSEWEFLAEVTPRAPLVVVDMDGFRRTGDARVRHSAVPLQRLRINIKDVDLTQAFLSEIRRVSSSEGGTSGPSLSRVCPTERPENWAVLGKHLCGVCADFALSCLSEGPLLLSQARVRLPIVVMATCCHHRCELRHLNPPEESGEAPAMLALPGTPFTWSETEFAALASMSSWAVCGDFVDDNRRAVGRKCKRIIDQIRVHFLRRLGYVALQCQYTTREVTEENVCIVAFQNP